MTTVVEVELESHLCSECSIAYGIPQSLGQRAREDKRYGFYCPNGHHQVYVRSELQKARAELEREVDARLRAQAALDQALAEQGTLSRELARVRKRGAAGLCQDCNRQFADLARHNRTKHAAAAERKAAGRAEKAKR